MYCNFSRHFISRTFQKIVARVRTFIKNWILRKLELAYNKLTRCNTELLKVTQDATVKVFVTSIQLLWVAMT